MRLLLFLIVVFAFPIAEFQATVAMAERIGWWLAAWLIVAALIGMAMIRIERLLWGVRLVAAMSRQGSPWGALIASAKTVIAGILLAFPGVLTDAIAIVLLLLPLRPPQPPPTPGADIIEGEFRRDAATVERIEDRTPPR